MSSVDCKFSNLLFDFVICLTVKFVVNSAGKSRHSNGGTGRQMTTCLRYYVNYNYFKTHMRSEVSEGNSTALKTGSLGAKHIHYC